MDKCTHLKLVKGTKPFSDKDKLLEEIVSNNIQKRKVKNSNEHVFKRIWSNLFDL